MIGHDATASLEVAIPAGQELADEPAGSRAALSHGQRSLWFLHHLAPVGGAYNIAAAARVLSPVDAGTLERAFQALVDRHAALRTTFPAVDGAPYRQVAGRRDFALARLDVTGWSAERLRLHLAAEAWRPFDLEHGPLLRVTLLTGDPGGPVILLVVHHIVADFWSLAILVRELPAVYHEAVGAGPARLAAPGSAYDEHVRLEGEALAGGRGEALLAYWKEKLAGLPALELALDRPRPAVQTYRGGCFRLRLPGELTAALRARSRERHGTLFMTLVAAFQALLYRHTGQEDLALGTPRAGRSHSQLAGTVGYFVNPVVLRGDLAGDPTFAELLERTRATVLAAFEHGEVPLPLLAEHLQPVRDASRTPLFQVSFVMQKETRGAEGLTAFALGEEGVEIGPEGFRLASLSLDRPPSPFDLMLHAVERQGGLSFALQYNSDLFDATTAQRLMERFAVLLRSIAGSLEQPLSALPILPEAEHHQLLRAWNDTAGAGCASSLFELFEAQAERTPEAVAVVFEEERTTYGELAMRARALAHHLTGLGVGPEALVGVAAERSTELVVGLLGVLGAGGAYLPLEPSLPQQRLAMILEDARPAVLLTHRSLAGALPLDAVPATRLAWLGEDPPPFGKTRRLARAAADSAAYVIYTSGSTGRPKGVVNSHRGIVNRLLWMREAYGLEESERFLQKTPFGFDVSVPEFFTPLITGGRLVVARPEGHRDSAYLSRLIRREGITTIHFIPSMLPFFLAEEGVEGCRSLRRVLVSGEALPWEVEQRCLAVLPVPLVNLYGPTEAAVEVTSWECRRSERPRPVPIGRPIRNTEIRVVGRRIEPVPPGAVGELAIGGVQVARGYLGRPDLTAERFVPDPFSAEAGARLYRTGDLARHLPGGEIEYLGRLDDQVKIRGFRIEPREIELALAAHPEVREAAVVVRQDPGSERSLLACVVLREGEPGVAIAADLRDFLAALLPPYMVPAFAFGGALDRLPNGKLDRRSLTRWTPLTWTARAVHAPRTPREELLAGLFAEILGVERIGAEDSFFEQGGHSLAAMRLVARVREAFGVELPLSRVFETPTVAALAQAIEDADRRDAPPLAAASRDVPLPLSFAQQRLWFLHQMEPASPAYNIPAALHLRGRLDGAVLAAALTEVARRHESLRTRFMTGPVQVIVPAAPVLLPEIDLTGLAAGERPAEARRLAREEALRPFDLALGPLLRTALVRLGEEERLLLLTLHHVISDGWSLRVLARELGAIYDAFSWRRPSPLPEPKIQYGDYAVWQRGWLQGEVLEAELAYWRARLADAPPVLDLPLDRPRPAVVSSRGASRALALSPVLLPSLQALARRQGVTLFMAVLAAFQALLARVSNVEDVSVGTPAANRGQLQTEGLIGFFVNTLVMRADLSGAPSFAELLPRVRETTIAAYAHQELPFEKLVVELHPQRDLSHAPLFQVSLSLDGESPPSLRLGQVEAVLWRLEQETEKFDLSLTLGMDGEGFSGALGFRTDLFDGATIERLAGHFVRLLAGAVAEPLRRVQELPLLSAAESRQILDWSTSEPAESETTLTALWDAQVARAPEAPAVTFDGKTLAYRDLDRRANRLAWHLRRSGVGPEARVGLLLERSLEMVVGLLGILKAGGAYVPLDPSAPAERLAFFCRDSALAVLVTDGRADLPPVATVVHLGVEPAAPREEDEREDERPPEPLAGPSHLCYVIYTSGSTGLPKGVLVRHGSVARLLSSTTRWFGFGSSDVWTLFHSITFDFSVWELWGALACGGRLVVVPYWVSRSPEALWKLLVEEGVTVLNQTPSAFRQLVQADGAATAAERERLELRLVIFGGEALDLGSLRAWYERHDPAAPRLVNMYGITETTVHVSYRPLCPADLEEPSRSPIGAAIPDLGLRLLGPGLELVPVGVAGEICVGGAGLARGYLGRPELTAERFVPDPFGRVPGDRLYRSGDLARHRPDDGQLDYLGRRDQQVKVRGFRIEPGEIESALLTHAEVLSAAVLPRQDAPGGSALVAYLETATGAVQAGEIRALLAARLPEYMVPAAYVFVDSMPLTSNGKLDRRALSALPLEWQDDAGAAEALRTPAEELVAGIFAEVLGVERVGPTGDFFALGGHSLLATQVASRVRSVFGVELPVRAVFEVPTVAGLAARLDRSTRSGETSALARVSRQETPILSFAQQRLWFLDRLEPGSPVYNIPVAVALTGQLDPAALEAALGEVVRRHEALRTTFQTVSGGLVQVVAESVDFMLPLIDVPDLKEANRRIVAEARRPFDLSRDPLLRALLLRSGAERHLLLLTMHHIVSDGWSMGVLVRELGSLYAAFSAGRPSPLPELVLQYADVAAWQHQHLAGTFLAGEIAWWRRELEGMPAALDLPVDHPRPVARSSRGAVHEFTLGRESLAALAALSRRQGTTLFMTLLAAFAGLLQRSTGQDDVAVGTPVAGRARIETEPLIGLFVNTLVLRTDLAGDPGFAELLGRVRERALSAYAHQEVPFERLVEELAPERDLSRPPLVQVLLALQNAPSAPLELPGLTLAVAAVPTGTAKLDLSCLLTETERGLDGVLEYSLDLFEKSTMERWAGHFARLLAGAAADPGMRLADLPLLAPAERAELLVAWNDIGTLPPADVALHELFEAQAARTPEAVALVDGRTGESWSYRRLDREAEALAGRLAGLGVGPEVRVGVCLRRTPLLVAALLGVLKAGGAYVPLDPGYPQERLAFLLEDAGVAVLLTQHDLAGCCGPFAGVVVEVDRTDLTDGTDLMDRLPPAPGNLAYLIYTSGSTGRPKGVAIEHRSAVAFARWARTVFAPGELGGVLAATSVSFDLSVFELFVPLAWGGKVILAANALELPRLVAADEVVLVNTVPSVLAELVCQGGLPPSVRTVNLAGEPLKRSLVDAIHASSPADCRVLDLYGPSEATTYSTWSAVPREESREPSIGQPIAGTRVVLLGRHGELVPAGVAGELLLGGAGLARGYLNRPELTAERFVPDPFPPEDGGEPGGRLYRTGDLARWRPDRQLDYLGRIDQQVKVRGFRIELGEIEAALLAHGAVQAAVVLAREDLPGGTGLVAWVVGDLPSANPLRDFLRERLPEFMVPAAFVFLESLPLTPNGKVDRKALAKMRLERESDRAGAAPRTPTEELVAGIFAEVLRLERVDIEESFFALGGHSLLATQVAARVRTVFGVELPVRAVFEMPTVAGLAGRLEGSAGERLATIPRDSRQESLPLSFAQQRLWFLDQLEPGSPLYNIPAVITLTGPLDRGVLAAALSEVVRRHEALRTAFPALAGQPVQLVEEPAVHLLPLIDLQRLPESARATEESRLAAAEARRPFDLGRGGLLRTALLRLAAERHALLLTMHHIVSDGWSLGILMRELGTLYAYFLAGRPSPLPELGIQYADFVAWQRRHLAEDFLTPELAWWRGQLAGMPPALELPTDHPRPAARSSRGAEHAFRIGGEDVGGLTALSRRHGATLFMTLLAGLVALLQRYTGEKDLVVGTPVAGRTRTETEPLIGFFVNTLALRTDVSGNPDVPALLAQVRETALAAYTHQEVPFERLVEELAPERDLSRPPLVQVLLAVQNAPVGRLELPGLALTASGVATGTAKLDLTFTLTEVDHCLEGTIEYSRDLFEGATIARLADGFVRLLAGAVADPGLRLSELPLLSAAERRQLLVEWNDVAPLPPSDTTLHGLFAAQAARAPEAVALVAGSTGERWTYRELDLWSDRLARQLADLGVDPEVRVGVCLPRTPLLVATLLGVLKAGGAYVPLDPEYPRERLEFLVEDSGAAVVVRGDLTLSSSGLPVSGRVLPSLQAQPGNLAYLIYTSGSTGRPKGVAIEHRSAVAFARWARTVFAPEELAGVLAATSVSFDLSVFELFVTLAWGGKVVLAANALELPRLAAAGEVVLVNTVPSAMAELVRQKAVPASVRTVNLAGEPLKRSLADAIHQTTSVSRLLDLYGPSEATTYSTWAAVRRGERREPSIGRPIDGTRVVLLGRSGTLVPAGVPGELFLGGAGLARSYFNRPDLTAERFVPDPFSAEEGAEPGGRLYRTGDLARWLPDGRLDYLGRIDQQVKVRGFRIELGEVEAALLVHGAVQAAAVLAREDLPGGTGLVAWVVADLPSPNPLRDFLRARLPEFMVPAAFVFLESLPLTPNGKVDRKALAKMRLERESDRAGAAPRTPTEELVAGIFAEVLGLEQVDVEESFFALGGHSLLATQVAARVRSVFGVELPVRAVFETPTVAGLAGRLEGPAGERLATIPRVSRQEPLPLAFAQQRLWFLDQLEPGSPLYNIPAAVTLRGRLDRGVLAAALSEVVRRHEALRTTFPTVAGQSVQLVEEPAVFVLPLIDLQGLPESVRATEESCLAATEARRPFDLGRGPLLRTALLRLAAERHVLLLTMHHIVSDGWSTGVMVREIGALYAAFAAGRPNPLPELAIQYADFAVWQRRSLAGEALDVELAWWRGQLAGMPSALELPTDHPRSAERNTRGAVHDFALEGEGLTVFSRRHGATLFMLLLAGFTGLLQRFTGEEDLVVGTPIAGRTRVETEPLIGFFVNTLVLRLGLAGSPSFLELLGRVRETALAAYTHQEVPFERLVEELAAERDRSRPSLVQVLFALQNTPLDSLALPGLELTVVSQATGTAKLELSCTLTETDHGLAGALEYNRDLFDHATAVRLAAGLVRFIEAAVEAPETCIADLPVLAPAERAALLFEWNDTAPSPSPASRAPLVHELFAEWARRQPEALAVAAPGERLGYGELAARAGRLARRLGRLGVGPEVRVALCAGATVHRVVGSLAVLLAGGAYVLMDPEAPPERLAFLVADSGAAAVLTERSLAGHFDSCAVPLVELESGEGEPASPWPAPAIPAVGPENLAYVVYTSGSTGLPKGVAVSHGGLLNLVRWHRAVYGLSPADRGTLIANPAFDAAVWELWPYLAAGASIHIPEAETRFSPQAIVRFWRNAGITWSFLPTPLAEEVMAEGAAPLAGLFLQGLLCGGDRLHRGPRLDAPFALINHYGPSEVSVVSTFAAVSPDAVGAPPIGRPIQGVRTFVADARGTLMPRGAAGELWIGGASLARGYLGRPALTAERFVPDPWSGAPGERLYRTGDLVRHRPGGSLEFLGRIDHQIKLRGFRIEPGEIEAALRGHPAVSEAAVTVSAQRLVAYVVVAGELAPSDGELRDFLRERLPGPLVPASYVVLAALPLTPNGKLDRKALPDPEPVKAADAFTPPRTPTEERVAGIFAEVLGVARVGVDDDFFALGGHSLLAARLAARVGSELGVELPVRSVFETPTVAGLAAWVERSAGGAGAAAPAPVVRVSREQPLALSFAQQRLWFLERIDPGASFFHLPAALDCQGLLDPAALARSLGEILRRHEVLRTRFALIERRPVQIPLAPAEIASGSLLPCVDLSAVSVHPVGEAEVARLTAAEASRPFDLERGPLLHAFLVRRGPESHRLLLTVHHAAADAWSVGLLIRELGRLYAAFTGGLPSPLPDLPLQYGDFAAWQRAHLRGERLEGHLRYWTEHLARLPTLELPTDRPRPPVQSHRGARRPVHLEAGATAGMRRLAGPAGVTLFMAVLAVFQAVLARHSGQEDVVVGTAVAERPDPALEEVIGLFLNTLVLRSDLSGDPAFRELLGRVHGVVLGALTHAELPFERLVEAMQPERDLSRSPLFQVFFALRIEPLPALDLPGLALRPAGTVAPAAQFDLSLHLEDSGGGLDGWIEYNPDLFDGPTVERLALHCGNLLAGAVASPDRRLSALLLLSEAERAQLVEEWNDTRLAVPGAAACIHVLFRAQVERTPDAVAAVDAGEALTYRELADRASRLAERLVRRGVRPGDRVGVCVERSLPMLCVLLGVLQAGAAYVPLDPAYPQARLAAMLEDSQAAALVASAQAGALLQHPRTLDPEAEEGAVRGIASLGLPAEAAAYVIYTSGSTGLPKGVVVSHRNAVRFFVAMDRELRPEGPGVWLAVTSICFDISVLELLWTLTRGFRVVIHDERSGASVAEQIARHGVSHLQCTPSLAGMLAASPERLQGLAPLSRLLLGGEALPGSLAARLCRTVGGEVRNLYGPTETTVWSLGERVEGEEERPLIGRPLANTEVYLLDASLRPVPLGSPGEVFLGGEGVAAGYWRRPDLTAERFLPDPLGCRPGDRLYRTGDLARHLTDGRLDFIGRSDHQVKVRGVRMELGEIEAALRAHPAVAQAAAVVRDDIREDARGDRRLIAYLVAAAGGAERDLAVGELRRFLAARLPEAMIPSAFVTLAALPLTQNGKVDRRALPAPEAGRPRLDSTWAAPRTPDEKTLAAIWQEVLGHERIGIHDNFFELGGSSLLLVEIESRLREAFGREIPIVQMFRHPTIHGLARELGAREHEPVGEAVAEGSAVDRQRQFLEEMKRRRAQQRRPGR